ncbi:MAG: TetR/AcrR family transcriptional regulator [Acidimicrobiales bacterium]
MKGPSDMVERDKRRRGPQQDRAVETRSRLLDHGLRAFAAKGHDGVSLARDVLDPAGVSVGSFYHQFSDKTELLLAILDDLGWARRRDVALSTVSAQSLDEAVAWGLGAFFDDMDADPDAWRVRVVVQGSNDERVARAVADLQAHWVEANVGMLGPWCDDDQATLEFAQLLAAFGLGVAAHYVGLDAAGRRRDRSRIESAARRFVIGGVRALGAADEPGRFRRLEQDL